MLHHNTDTFVEYMVKKRYSGKDNILIASLILVSILLIYICLFILPGIFGTSFTSYSLLVIFAVIYGTYFVISRKNIEYEYTFTNGDVSIDKILNKKSRKRLTSFDCEDLQEIGDYDRKKDSLKARSFNKTFMVGSYDDGRNNMYVIANSKNTGLTLIVFEPNETMTEAIKDYVPRQMRIDYWGR